MLGYESNRTVLTSAHIGPLISLPVNQGCSSPPISTTYHTSSNARLSDSVDEGPLALPCTQALEIS